MKEMTRGKPLIRETEVTRKVKTPSRRMLEDDAPGGDLSQAFVGDIAGKLGLDPKDIVIVDPNVTLTPAAQPVSTAAPPVSCKETKTNYAVLVHGYCQPGPWSVWRDAIDQGIFKLAWEYQDFGGNWDGAYLSVFDFANNLRRALESAELGACSIIAHSQGGMASLYMHHHFKTCLDMHEEHMPGSRLIQTVGTPYKGSPLMRSEFLVTLAQVFLGTCGYVRDLDPTHQSGELSWHQNISVESESDVHYFTTRGTAGKPCASDTTRWLFASGLLFSRYAENDGVTANHLAGLDSGHAMGTTSGQCHSENAEGVHRYGHMPQYMDMARNLEMYTARRKAVGSRACDESESDHIIFNVDTGNPVDDGSNAQDSTSARVDTVTKQPKSAVQGLTLDTTVKAINTANRGPANAANARLLGMQAMSSARQGRHVQKIGNVQAAPATTTSVLTRSRMAVNAIFWLTRRARVATADSAANVFPQAESTTTE
eukprot:CAMPEP_0184305942 /NCGR_PEP_ID=MMETSP1049-20130417/15072_1 /TAXON_ID=77928 /ORGANISM="Proteomonas sulcata, Strain CCMP704" /LENGTH=483 /DNA_ID=CAMNT_0026618101 /DNA_START=138 /DNA_END=1590 /DNA_ORIENTATION=+